MCPDAIGGRLREMTILRMGNPSRQLLATRAIGYFNVFQRADVVCGHAVATVLNNREARLDHGLRFRQFHFPVVRIAYSQYGADHFDFALRTRDLSEVGRQTPEVFLRPVIKRVIVALSTFHPHAQETARRASSQFFGVHFRCRIKQQWSGLVDSAFGHQEFSYQFIIRLVFAK